MKTQRFILFILCVTLFFSTISSAAYASIEQPQTELVPSHTCYSTESSGEKHIGAICKRDVSETMNEYSGLTQGHIAGEWEILSAPTYHQQGYREQHCVVCYELLNTEEIPALSRYDTAQFNGHSYKIFDESLPWTEAEAICESLGGHLVAITSQTEMQFIINLIDSGYKSIYWMGLNRDNEEREWRWVSGEAVEYTNWRPGEPNDALERGEYYGSILIGEPFLSVKGTWNDTLNTGDVVSSSEYSLNNFGYICEWDTEDIFIPELLFGLDRFTFGKDMSGYIGEEIKALLVYTSKDGNIASLNITSSNPDIVEIGEIVELGKVEDPFYDDSIGQNEHAATVTLRLKAEGSSTITVSSPEGDSTSVNVKVESVPKSIAVFSTERSRSVAVGDSLWLAFGLLKNGTLDDTWRKMAITVSNPDIISLSDYTETEYGYMLEAIGKKEGSTNVTITDSESGASTTIVVSVYDKYVRSYSYAIDNMAAFYPNNKFEGTILTNIYNLNGLYVNNYKVVNSYGKNKVSFDVYNTKYYYGAVDVYDANGNWIDYKEIKKFSSITSLWDVVTSAGDTGKDVIDLVFYLITDRKTGNVLTYTQASYSECTHIEIEVPENGYFTISNNIVESPGTYFANAFEILFDGASTALDLALSGDVKKTAFDGFYADSKKALMERMVDVLIDKSEAGENLQKIFLGTMKSEIQKITKNIVSNDLHNNLSEMDNVYSGIAGLAENVIASFKLDWRHFGKTSLGVGQSLFETFGGSAGVALKGCFALNKASDKLLMGVQMARSTDNTYATVYSSIEEGYVNQHGVVVNTGGNVDSEAVLQVFRISNDDSVSVLLDNDNPLENHELFNICFVKNDQLVQPNGNVKVYVPIPQGMNESTCKIYRQENDGSWTILDAHIEGNYLVFETNHFSLYSVIGDMTELSISSLPNKLIYKEGDMLITDGLTLELNNKVIVSGFICEPTVLSGTGKQTVTVKYGCTSTEFTVNVNKSDGYNISGLINSSETVNDLVIVKLLQRTTEITSIETAEKSYNFGGITPGTYTLEVSKANHVTRTYQVTVSDSDVTQNVEIHLIGDINGDGAINAQDALMALQHSVGLIQLDPIDRADVDGNGRIDASDALLILQKSVNLISHFPAAG